MRVLQLNKYFAAKVGREQRVGGVERMVHQLSTGLADRGLQVRALASHHHVDRRTRRETTSGVSVRRCGTLGFAFNTPVSPAYPIAYRRLVRWADVVHFHTPSPPAEVSHAMFGLSETPAVVTFHADPVRTRHKAAATLYSPVLRRLLSAVACIAVTAPPNLTSPSLASHRDKCRVIPLAAEPTPQRDADLDPEELRESLGLDSQQPTILFVGRLAYYKGLHYLLRALSQAPGQLVVVGEGEQRRRLSRQAEELGLSERVVFCGYVPERELPAYYEVADLFVLPSTSSAEAFGIVQIEAMGHGLPVINTDLPTGVPYVSKDGETGLTTPPGDSRALASAIRELAQDEERRRQFARAAKERAQKFTVTRMVDRYIALYNEVCSE